MSNISPLFAVEAEELLKAGRAQEAIELCKQGIEAFPNYTIAYGILARAHSAIGDTAVAESVLENAAQHFPRSKTIRKIVDLSHSGDINQILHEFEETLEKQSKAKNQSQKKKSKVQKVDKVTTPKESDVINELIEDIEYERFVQKKYQEKIFTQAEISDLKLIFTSDKIDAYVLPFKANFVDKNKRAAHFSHDNFMFPPLFFDIKFNPEKITSPVLNFDDETDDLEKDMFFDDAIATFNTSLSMNNESDELEAKQELLKEEIIESEILEEEVEEIKSLDNIQQDEEYLTTENETEEEVLIEANQSESTFDELFSNLETDINTLPENDTTISDDATQSLLQKLAELDIIQKLDDSSDIVEDSVEMLSDEEKIAIEDEIMDLVGDLDKSLIELEKHDIFDQVESPILEESAVRTDKYTDDVDIMAMIEELENPNSGIHTNTDLEQYEPNADDLLEQELLSDFDMNTNTEEEQIFEQEELEQDELEQEKENVNIVGDIIGKIITDETPRNMTIEQIGNQLSNFGAEEIEEVEEENYSDFASETIAEIFAEQGAYTNAIKMYTKLIDQEPEKADYFLSRIEEIKILKNQ